MSTSRRDEWRRRVERFILDGVPVGAPLAPEVQIPDVRWLQALTLAAYERTADATGRAGPWSTVARMGETWQAALVMSGFGGFELDHRMLEWCWLEGGESWDVEDLLLPPSS